MKMVPDNLLRSVTLVDSPGMIDSAGEGIEYNFVEAVKWFVERADLVCFFFDPEKPGSRYCMRMSSLFIVVAVVCVQMVVV
jgi:predicted GTPase